MSADAGLPSGVVVEGFCPLGMWTWETFTVQSLGADVLGLNTHTLRVCK